MEELDVENFWKPSAYALERYVETPPTPSMIASIEKELGYQLPAFYVKMMHFQNGGLPQNTCFPVEEATSWAGDHIAITGIFGIGREKTYALCGELGSAFMLEEWGYPAIGVCIANCPSAGHDMVMLDYRTCGSEGEPTVVHVDQEDDYKITFLAKDFETFVKGLVNEKVYDTAEEDLQNILQALQQGHYSDTLAGFLKNDQELAEALRKVLIQLTEEKGYFALHADELSYLVYDVQFYLYTQHHSPTSKEKYLEDYPKMIAFGNREITTRGYAPNFVEDWLQQHLKKGNITQKVFGGLHFTPAYEDQVLEKIDQYQ